MQRIYENMTSRLLAILLSSGSHMDDCRSRRWLPTLSGMSNRQRMGRLPGKGKGDGRRFCQQAACCLEAVVVRAPHLLAHQHSRNTGERVSNINKLLSLCLACTSKHQKWQPGLSSFALLVTLSIGCKIAIGREWRANGIFSTASYAGSAVNKNG